MIIATAMIVMQVELCNVCIQFRQPEVQIGIAESKQVTGIKAKTDSLIFKAIEDRAHFFRIIFVNIFEHQPGALT